VSRRPGELAAFWGAISIANAAAWCRRECDSGRTLAVHVEASDGSKPRTAFAFADWRRRVRKADDAPDRIRVLAPFDPIIRDRKRAQRLFDFDYRFEAFVPAKKRKYGYYVLPLLERDRLVGRIDPRHDRDAGKLIVDRVWWERGTKPTRVRKRKLEAALQVLAGQIGADTVQLKLYEVHTMKIFATEIEETAGTLAARGACRDKCCEQQYDSHVSIHDDAMAQKLGFKGGAIEGPTHFSQFVRSVLPRGASAGSRQGVCPRTIATSCYEGDKVRAFLTKPLSGATQTTLWMQREDGHEVLRGTASAARIIRSPQLEQRLTNCSAERPVILRDVKVGTRGKRIPVRMEMHQHMGALYPFSLADKLKVISGAVRLVLGRGGESVAMAEADHPSKMISVLAVMRRRWIAADSRPVVGLFADQEIRLLHGPLYVGDPYEIDREVAS